MLRDPQRKAAVARLVCETDLLQPVAGDVRLFGNEVGDFRGELSFAGEMPYRLSESFRRHLSQPQRQRQLLHRWAGNAGR